MLITLFFFNDNATSVIYTLSLHDALPIYDQRAPVGGNVLRGAAQQQVGMRSDRGTVRSAVSQLEDTGIGGRIERDRKSTRLNSSHVAISYAVFCLKKKKRKSHT